MPLHCYATVLSGGETNTLSLLALFLQGNAIYLHLEARSISVQFGLKNKIKIRDPLIGKQTINTFSSSLFYHEEHCAGLRCVQEAVVIQPFPKSFVKVTQLLFHPALHLLMLWIRSV